MTTLNNRECATLLAAASFCDEWAQICRNSDICLSSGKFVNAESKAEHDSYVSLAGRLRNIVAKARASVPAC